MEFVKKIAKSLLIGCITGIGIAILTQFFLKSLIDRLENMTYDMRYYWQYGEMFQDEADSAQNRENYGIHIVNIDDRSTQKLGVYWNWDRSYHAQLISSLRSQYPAVIGFDILFYDPEDANHQARIDALLRRSNRKNPDVTLPPVVQQSILHSIDYDKQFQEAASEAGNVFFGISMANDNDYVNESDYRHKTTMAWHQAMKPTSALLLSPEIREEQFGPSNQRPILDGLFPQLAQAGEGIGYLNMVPDPDGTIRTIPIAIGFGDNPPVYLPFSVKIAAYLFGTAMDEIELVPGRFLDIGRPFKIVRRKLGELDCSYPQVTPAQVKALIDTAEAILGLHNNQRMAITALLKTGKDSEGFPFIDMNCGEFPHQIVEAFLNTDLSQARTLDIGDALSLGTDIVIQRETEEEWLITAPFGWQEYLCTAIELATLCRVSPDDFAGIDTGETRLLFHSFAVKRLSNRLVSTIPVLREQTLEQLCRTPWSTLTSLTPGTRMEFGKPVHIPLKKRNEHIITYFGPKAKPFPYFSYYDIMKNRVHGNLEGKIFIVGSTAPAMFDIKPVPHDKNFAAVEIHASLLNSFLTNTFVRKLSDIHNFVILLLVGIIIGFLSYMVRPLPGFILMFVAILGYFLIAMTVFGTALLWIEIARPLITLVMTFIMVMIYRYITEEKDRKFLQSTFKHYLSPELIDMMYKEKSFPQLGGDEGIRTAYFTDIQGFSTFSEKLGSPTRLVELLNEYLTVMTDTLLSHFGTLDKYEGDAIIAFFGAPMPMDDHAHQACLTALGMQEKLAQLRRKWVEERDKWPTIVHEMRMRIGINTGAITTGNMGSAVRMNYTMMGDAVNLAARLEAAAKQYGIYTMVSNYTYDYIKNDFELRQLDKITVVGKSEPVTVYELLAEKGKLEPAQSELVDIYRESLNYFYRQEWDKALENFHRAEEREPYRNIAPKGVTPSNRFIRCCEEYKVNPPGPEWDGVTRLTSK